MGTTSKSPNHCEIVIHGYGNGLTESLYTEPARFVPVEMTADSLPEIVTSNNSPPRLQQQRSMSASDVRPRSANGQKRPEQLVLSPRATDIKEKIRTPLMNSFD